MGFVVIMRILNSNSKFIPISFCPVLPACSPTKYNSGVEQRIKVPVFNGIRSSPFYYIGWFLIAGKKAAHH